MEEAKRYEVISFLLPSVKKRKGSYGSASKVPD